MKVAVFNLGFRLFFLLAGWFAVISVALWSAIYFDFIALPSSQFNSIQWHGHEMIYGYSLAVITGFLLTSVRNWTGLQTLHGPALCVLACFWLSGRISLAYGLIVNACISDLVFLLFLNLAIAYPIIKAKQWKQLAVLSKLLLLLIFNLLFYLGVFGLVDKGVYLGLYGGFYLIVGLILMMGRRLIPFFSSRALGDGITMPNSVFLDRASLIVFLVFFIAELYQAAPLTSGCSALILAIVNALRLYRWQLKEIWQHPLLWVLYLALWSICLGFLLHFLNLFFPSIKYLALHALAYGGIGLITLGMMARVSLGHTGRDIYQPPQIMTVAFVLLVIGTVIRVVLPLVAPVYYIQWVGISQALWITAFLLFLIRYTKILILPRVDGKPG